MYSILSQGSRSEHHQTRMSEEGDSGAFDGAGDGDDGPEVKIETAPFDPRFPNMNQTKHCFTSFLDYHRCIKVHGLGLEK